MNNAWVIEPRSWREAQRWWVTLENYHFQDFWHCRPLTISWDDIVQVTPRSAGIWVYYKSGRYISCVERPDFPRDLESRWADQPGLYATTQFSRSLNYLRWSPLWAGMVLLLVLFFVPWPGFHGAHPLYSWMRLFVGLPFLCAFVVPVTMYWVARRKIHLWVDLSMVRNEAVLLIGLYVYILIVEALFVIHHPELQHGIIKTFQTMRLF